jgi:hypothetical protein
LPGGENSKGLVQLVESIDDEIGAKLAGRCGAAVLRRRSSGIGYAIAKRYLEADGRVVIADLNRDGAAKAVKDVAGEKSAIGVGMDVSNEDQLMPRGILTRTA